MRTVRRELNQRLDEQKERLVNEAEVALRAQEEKLSAGVVRHPRPAEALEIGPDEGAADAEAAPVPVLPPQPTLHHCTLYLSKLALYRCRPPERANTRFGVGLASP